MVVVLWKRKKALRVRRLEENGESPQKVSGTNSHHHCCLDWSLLRRSCHLMKTMTPLQNTRW